MNSKIKQKGQSMTSKEKQIQVCDTRPDVACGMGQVIAMPEDRDRQAQDGGPADETASAGYRISSGGFDADVESVAYITEDDRTSLWFLSAVGTQQSCKTTAAKMLKQALGISFHIQNRATCQKRTIPFPSCFFCLRLGSGISN